MRCIVVHIERYRKWSSSYHTAGRPSDLTDTHPCQLTKTIHTKMMWPPRIAAMEGTGAQNICASLILGAAPGIYLSIVSLGAGAGQPSSTRFSNLNNCILNGTFGLFSLFAPLLIKYANLRWFLVLGPLGYASYIGGLIYFQATDRIALPLVLGVVCGFGAALIWTGTTYMSVAYSTPATKGRFINTQWMGLAAGSTIGSAIAFGSNFSKTRAVGVGYGTLGAWMAIHVSASLFAFLFVLPTNRVKTPNGHIIPAGGDVIGDLSVLQLVKEMFQTITATKVLLVVAAMLTSDFWLIFAGAWNARNFNLRTRSLNTLLYWAIQIPTAEFLTLILDRKTWTRRKRGLVGFCLLFFVVCASWAAYFIWQALHIETANRSNKIQVLDWTSGASYGGGLCVYLLWGLSYPCYHVVLVWYIGALTNEGDRKLAFYSGLFKACQAFGIALSFGIGSTLPNMMTEAAFYCAFAVVSLLPMGYGFLKYVKDEVVVDLFENERSSIEVRDPQTQSLPEDVKDEVHVSVAEK